jgi:DmsE family decaheme c-type cytochrome
VLAACVSLQWEPMGPRRTAPVEGAAAVGSEECAACHEDVQGHKKIAFYHAGCETCHGGGSLHADTEATADIRYPSNADCLACHAVARDSHLSWGSGEHSRAGVLCSDCHNPHDVGKRHLREVVRPEFRDMDQASGLCVSCHEDVAMRLSLPSHHPVGEGILACTSCHDPHEDQRVSLGGRNQLCEGCHQDYAGPWTFEHQPVVDDCTTCHDPHGAVADGLLHTIQPVICISCHPVNDLMHHDTFATGIAGNQTGAPPTPTTAREAHTFLDRCTDCHGAIHGSYGDAKLRH